MGVPKDEFEITYALSRMVQEIKHRTVFTTKYGDLTLEGKVAVRIAAIVERELRNMLRKYRSKK